MSLRGALFATKQSPFTPTYEIASQAPNDMICHSAVEKRPLVEWPALSAGRIETKGAVELLAMTTLLRLHTRP